ncbi:MAG: phenylalanyl-tRNA synthetase alpha chain [Parcubacteria group bacterium LiPW_72]|nr:MAG: phenylalanyl-tRNA synthetase alpha chain [Parcubacteria group bacterium LiPW_72]
MASKLREKLEAVKSKALADLLAIQSNVQLESFRVKYLGRKGELAEVLKGIKNLPVLARPEVGQCANRVKRDLETAFQNKRKAVGSSNARIFIDITQPGVKIGRGHLHLVTQAIREVERIFLNIGFVRRRYPEVETDYYAFEALNMPSGHPARDEWETFFLQNPKSKTRGNQKIVLTPHTSSGQVREMENHPLPIRMMNISKCYRRQIDINHVPMFHQFEGLVVDQGIQFVHLKGVLEYFCREFFGEKRKIRLRPFHFRFTEPSFEVDVTCGLCGGKGCRYCKQGWSELGGAGMVHPNVLRAGGQDPRKVTGFAFGWGVERCYLMKEGLLIPDLRMFYQNDLRFLEQF